MAVLMQAHLASVAGELRYEPTVTRVRALVGDDVVLDTVRAILVWEPGRIVPAYAVPAADLVHGAEPAVASTPGDHTSPGEVLDVRTADGVLAGAGYRLDDPDLAGVVVVDFAAFDSWLVEEEARLAHPHDPFKRISVHESSRLVEVSLDDTLLASSTRALMLLETHLPPRWYLPPEDVRTDLLEPSDHRTECAYKGQASYLSLPGRARNICWFYPEPLDDALRIGGRLCFWSERTDLRLDGQPVPTPVTHWSTPEG